MKNVMRSVVRNVWPSRSGRRRRVGASVLAAALICTPFVAVTPASAVETITTTPATYDPTATMTIRVDGFPNMGAAFGYIYWLDFQNLTGAVTNTGVSTGALGSQTDCAATTGVTFTLVAGAGDANPNGQNKVGNTNGCEWMTTTKFKFSYTGTAGLNNTSIVDITFPIGSFALPAGGQYGVNFTAGATQQYQLSYVCWGECPVGANVSPRVTLTFDGNGGTCSPDSVQGVQGTWGTALKARDCSFGSRQLQGFATSPTLRSGSVFVRPEGPVYFLADNTLYAIWALNPPTAPQNVVATPGPNSMTVTWKPPASDGGEPIQGYQVRSLASNGGSSASACLTAANVYQCKFSVPATNVTFSYTVVAYNRAGNGPASAGTPQVSPYDFGTFSASRPNILLGLGGSRVDASGTALGLAGKAVNVQFKVGSAKDWTTQANAATVNAEGKFSWSKKFGFSQNRDNVSLRFTYGTDLVSGTYVLARGGEAGSLTAPRNVKIENTVNRIKVSWDPPKFDGGETITGYTMCAKANGSLCRDASTEGSGIFWGLEPGREYTITVAAKTAKGTGPAAEAKGKVSPVEASVRITRRFGQEIRVETEASGFKAGAKFRLEAAVAVPGEPASAWRWEELQSFTGSGYVNRGFAEELSSFYEGEPIAVRLVTLNGTVYSRLSRP